jgi:ATP-dependent DNA helicase RecQ
MNSNEIDIHKELKKYFGFSQFKDCKASDPKFVGTKHFVIMPTGGGKSLATSYH